MTDKQLAKEPHELKRRRETPLPLIEIFDALLSLAPGLSAKQKRKRSDKIMATALKRLEREDARQQPEADGAPAHSCLRAANILVVENLRPSAGRSQDALTGEV
jgi:hypothetical protein